MTCIHTCKLEFDTFFLHRDMIDQIFFPNGYPYKFYASPLFMIAAILFFDVIADKGHLGHVCVNRLDPSPPTHEIFLNNF